MVLLGPNGAGTTSVLEAFPLRFGSQASLWELARRVEQPQPGALSAVFDLWSAWEQSAEAYFDLWSAWEQSAEEIAALARAAGPLVDLGLATLSEHDLECWFSREIAARMHDIVGMAFDGFDAYADDVHLGALYVELGSRGHVISDELRFERYGSAERVWLDNGLARAVAELENLIVEVRHMRSALEALPGERLVDLGILLDEPSGGASSTSCSWRDPSTGCGSRASTPAGICRRVWKGYSTPLGRVECISEWCDDPSRRTAPRTARVSGGCGRCDLGCHSPRLRFISCPGFGWGARSSSPHKCEARRLTRRRRSIAVDVDERQRYRLHQTLEHHLGSDAAATLMTLLPPVGWADVATKHDLVVLRQDLDGVERRLGLRITAEIAGVRTELHKTARTMTFANIGATAAIVTAIAIVTSLFG